MEYKVVITFDAESDLDGLLIYLFAVLLCLLDLIEECLKDVFNVVRDWLLDYWLLFKCHVVE